MTLSTLDAEQLYFATLAGCHAVVRERETLNAINVFPVQDGDTGDNMAATASAVIHHAALQTSIKATLQSVADASMTGARGNSGMIFSQFFNALADGAIEGEPLNMPRFSELLQTASTRVRAAILNPVDGTMLTVMEFWSTYTKDQMSHIPCFKALLQTISKQLQDVVAQTTQTLAALKQAGVVDAGALGFFHFVNGFSRFIADPTTLPSMQSLPELAFNLEPEQCAHEHPTQGRYCTEAMIKGEHLDQQQLMDTLKQYGDSIVVSVNAHLCRFHLHTDTPWAVFGALQTMGQLQMPKVDDMLRQFQTIYERKHAIALVTDSNADLPPRALDEHQIHQIALNIHIDGHDFLDKYSITAEQFYDRLPLCKVHPKTSFPSILAIEQRLKPIADKYSNVLVLSVSQALSGTHDAIKLAAEKYNHIYVMNSKHCSAAQGILLAEAAEKIEEQVSMSQLVEHLQSCIPHTHFWFMVRDLSALIRSGRINKLLGKMAQFSGVRLLFSMTPEGKAHLTGQAFSESAALQKIIQAVKTKEQEGLRLKRYAVVHANALAEAKQFAMDTKQAFHHTPDYVESVSVSVGVHAGTGCVGLAALFE